MRSKSNADGTVTLAKEPIALKAEFLRMYCEVTQLELESLDFAFPVAPEPLNWVI